MAHNQGVSELNFESGCNFYCINFLSSSIHYWASLIIEKTELEVTYPLSHPYLHPIKKTQLCSHDTWNRTWNRQGGSRQQQDNTLATWCEEPTRWKRPWWWDILRAGGEGVTEDEWLDGITDSMDVSLSKLQEIPEGQGSPACCSPRGRKDSNMTERLNKLNNVSMRNGCPRVKLGIVRAGLGTLQESQSRESLNPAVELWEQQYLYWNF